MFRLRGGRQASDMANSLKITHTSCRWQSEGMCVWGRGSDCPELLCHVAKRRGSFFHNKMSDGVRVNKGPPTMIAVGCGVSQDRQHVC